MRRALLLLLPLLASCSRCGGPSAPDAAAAPRVRHSTDLRTVAITVFPEYRGAQAHDVEVVLTRTVKGATDWRQVLASTFATTHFLPDDGGTSGTRPPFRVELVREGADSADFALHLPLDGGGMEKLYQVAVPLSSLDLGLMLPRGGGLTTEREVFTFHLEYEARDEARAAFMSRQLVELCLGNGQWTLRGLPAEGWGPMLPDGGFGAVPDQFAVTVVNKVDGATITVHRAGAHVTLDYALVTDAPAP